MHAYMRTYEHTYMQIARLHEAHIHTHTYIYTYVHIHTYIHTCMQIANSLIITHEAYIHTYRYAIHDLWTASFAYVHTKMNSNTHVYTIAFMNTYTWVHSSAINLQTPKCSFFHADACNHVFMYARMQLHRCMCDYTHVFVILIFLYITGTQWEGQTMRIEPAKETYMDRLQVLPVCIGQVYVCMHARFPWKTCY